jgi:hypothetical protein
MNDLNGARAWHLQRSAKREWKECEEEAGHPLLTLGAVYEFRLRPIRSQAVEELLNGSRS